MTRSNNWQICKSSRSLRRSRLLAKADSDRIDKRFPALFQRPKTSSLCKASKMNGDVSGFQILPETVQVTNSHTAALPFKRFT